MTLVLTVAGAWRYSRRVDARARTSSPERAPAARVGGSPAGVRPPSVGKDLIELQRSAGNRAVGQMLQRRESTGPPARLLKAGQVLHAETRAGVSGQVRHEFTGDFTVAKDGTLTFGSGNKTYPVKVGGLSVQQAADRLARVLVDDEYMTSSAVTATAFFDGLSVTATGNAVAAQTADQRERKPYLDYVAGLRADDARVARYLMWVQAQDAASLSLHTPARAWVWALRDPDAPASPRDVALAKFNDFFVFLNRQLHSSPKTDYLQFTRDSIAVYEYGRWIDRHQESADLLKADPGTIYGQIVTQASIHETERETQAKFEAEQERKKPTRSQRDARLGQFLNRADWIGGYSQRKFPYGIDLPSRRKYILVTGDPALQKVLDDISGELRKWAYVHLMDADYLTHTPDAVLAEMMDHGDYWRRINEAQRKAPVHEEQSTVQDSDLSARGVLVSFGETILKGLAAIAAVGLFVGAEIITGGQATWLLLGVAGMDGIQSYMARRQQIEAAGYDVPVTESLLDAAGDVIGVSEVIEGMSGQQLGSGLELTGTERDERIGGAAGNVVLMLTGSHAYKKGFGLGSRFRRAEPVATGTRHVHEPAPTPGAKERAARAALTKELQAGFDLWMDDIRARGRSPETVLDRASPRQIEGLSAASRRRDRQQMLALAEEAYRKNAPADTLRPKRSTVTRVQEGIWLHYDGAPPPPLDVALAVKIAEETGEPVYLYGPQGGGKAAGAFDGTIGTPPRRLSLDLHRIWQDAGLTPSGLERLLTHVTPEQALGLSRWLPPGRLDAAGNDAALIRRAVSLDARFGPQLADPVARTGILRLTELQPKGRSRPTSTTNLLKILAQFPEEAVGSALRMMADPAFGHPQGFQWNRLLGKRTPDLVAALRFADEFGYEAYTALSSAKLAEPVRNELDAEHDPAIRQARVQELLDMSTVGREIELGIRRPPRYRKLTEAKPDTGDPAWKQYVADAKDVMDRNAELAGPRNKQRYGQGNSAAIDAYATILQVRDRIRVNWARYQEDLSYDAKIRILDQIDALGAKGDLQHGWVNNLRGSVGEALFGPNGGHGQKRLPNPLHPAKPRAGAGTGAAPTPAAAPRPGFTRLDDSFAPGKRPRGGGGGPPTPGKEWVEIKTDRIDAAPATGDIARDAVDAAKTYRKDAREDWDALLANAETRNDVIVMQFARKPRNDATRAAMLNELFSKQSPITAVRFGEEAWIERPIDKPMPDIDPRLRAGPIVGVPARPRVYGPEP